MALKVSRNGLSRQLTRLAGLIQKKKKSTRSAKRSRLFLETLENRTLLASDVYVNDTWFIETDIGNDGLNDGDIVSAANDGGSPAGMFTFGEDAFATIQDAIDEVEDGGTVNVVAGTYAESPLVNKSVTLQSVSGKDVTTIQLQTSSSNYLNALTLSGAGNDITVDGFTIQGFDGTSSLLAPSNILLDSGLGNVLITNNDILVGARDTSNPSSALIDSGFGVLTSYGPGNPVAELVVSDNTIAPLNSAAQRAFYINPDVTQFTFSDNVVTGNFLGTALTQAHNSTITDNVVTGVGAAGSRSGGFAAWGDPNPDAGYGTSVFSGNTFTNTRGISLYDLKVSTVSNNTFVNNDGGVALYDFGYGVTDISGIHINNNSFTGTNGFAINSAAYAAPIDAQTNWFGTNDSSAIAALVDGNVDYSPWLNTATDTSADPGFQGDLGSLRVGLGGAHIGPAGRIQEGINLVTVGGAVNIDAGTYVENINVNKKVTLLGVGNSPADTVIAPASGTAFTVSVSGVSMSDRLVIQNLRVAGATTGFSVSGSHVKLDDVVISSPGGDTYGIQYTSSAGQDFVIEDSTLDGNNLGGNNNAFRMGTGANLDGLTISNTTIENYVFGMTVYVNNSLTPSELKNVLIEDSTFQNNSQKGVYMEKLQDALFDNVTFTNNGTDASYAFNSGIDINLKHNDYSNITIQDSTFTNNGTGAISAASPGTGITIKARNDGATYGPNPATLTGVTLSNVTINATTGVPGAVHNLALGNDNDLSGFTLSNVDLGGTGSVGLNIYLADASETLDLADTDFAATLAAYISNSQAGVVVDATGATFGGVSAGAGLTNAQAFAIADKVIDNVDVATFGGVVLKDNNVYVTTNSFYSPLSTTPSIQRGINAANVGDTVNVAAGTYVENINVNKQVTLQGAGDISSGTPTIVDGSAGGTSSSAISISGSGASAVSRLEVKDLHVIGTQANSFNFATSVSYVTLQGVSAVGGEVPSVIGARVGVNFEGPSTAITDVVLDDISMSGFFNGGISIGAGANGVPQSINGFTLTNSNLSNNRYGLHEYASSATTNNQVRFTNVLIADNTIENNSWKGLYFEALNNATIEGNLIKDNGLATGMPASNSNGNNGIDVNLKYGNFNNVDILNNVFDNSGNFTGTPLPGADVSGALAIKPRNLGGYAANPATLNDVLVSGNIFQNINPTIGKAILIGENGTVMPTNLVITNNVLSDGTFRGLVSTSPGVVEASGNWWGTTDAATINSSLAIGDPDSFIDFSAYLNSGVDTNGIAAGFAGDFSELNVTTLGATTGATGRIQDGVNLVTAGGTVNVGDGTYVENVTISKSLSLLSNSGRDFTTIQGVVGPEQGTVYLTAGTDNVTIGGATGNGFEIIGIDGAAASEKSAIYLQGAHSNLQILSNDVVANGDGGLTSEYGQSLTNVLIDNNIFSGQTFNGANPAGDGSAAQFSLLNVPRQLVVMSPNANSSGLVFSNNDIVGVAGGISLTDNSGGPAAPHEQGNTLVTIDANGAIITDNAFAGTTTSSFATSLRARGENTTISDNDFDSTGLSSSAGHVYIKNIGVDTAAVALANTFDKGAFVNGVDATIYHDFAALVSVLPAINVNIPVSVLEGTYTGNVDSTLANRVVTLSPFAGASTGVTASISGDLSVDAGDTLAFDFYGAANYDQFAVSGSTNLGGATLSINIGFAPTPGSTFTLIDGTSISGTFAGLPEGAVISSGGYSFSVSYLGGDVTLTTLLDPLSITGTGSDDTFVFDYMGATTAVTVNNVPLGAIPSGAISIDGLGGTNTVTVNGTNSADTFSVGAGNIGVGALNITVSNVQVRVANGEGGNDTFNLSGNVLGATLNGGNDDDTFVFDDGASTTGSINGGNGINTLDYSLYSTGVTVTLGSGAATGISAITAIQNVFGGEGADSLTGDGNANVLSGNGDNDIINGGSGNDTLSGGAGNDSLIGGGQTDTLIESGDVDFTLADLSLSSTATGNDTLSGIEVAVLTGGASDNVFTLSGWTGAVTIDGVSGADTVSVTKNIALFELTNGSLTTSDDLVATLYGISVANLTGGTGSNSFDVSGWTGTGTINGASGTSDTLISENDADMTLALTSFAVSGGGANLTLAGIEIANLTGGASANNFNVSGWTKKGSITGNGGADTITATKNKNFTLANGSLVTTDSMNLTLAGIGNAVLTGGASANQFTVSEWTGTGTIAGDTGNDTLIAVKNHNFVLTNSSIQTTDSMSLGLTSIEVAKLTGGASDNEFNLDGWSNSAASTINGLGGTDTLVVERDANFTLTNTKLTVKVGSSTQVNATLTQMENVELTGGDSANTFTVSAYTGDGSIDGGDGSDTIVKTANKDFVLTNSSLTATDGLAMSLVSVDIANLTGGSSANVINISGWTKTGKISGSSGNDELIVSKNADITIASNTLYSSDGMSVSISAFETATLTGGDDDNRLDASAFSLVANLSGGGGNDILLGGNGVNTLNGGAGRDILIGGNGADTLNGDGDSDILIGARTNYGNNFTALDKIMDEWESANDYSARVANIKAGLGATLGTVLSAANILDDSGATDELTGGADQDWFFEKLGVDDINDLEGGELIENY